MNLALFIRMVTVPAKLAGVACLLLAVSGCTGKDVRSAVGLKRNQPDAFQVVSRPPLSVPPVYHLRPPSEEASRLTPADSRASALVLEGRELPLHQHPDDMEYLADTAVTPVTSGAVGSQGESLLLRNAGAMQADPQIRATLREESASYDAAATPSERSFTDKLRRGWFVADDGDPVVDAGKEQERLRTNKQEEKPLNEGEVPVIDPKKEGFLGKLF